VLSYDDKVEIEAEIAGFHKEDISVQIEDDVLSIAGKTSQPVSKLINLVYLLRELKRSSFSRSFRLTDRLDSDKVEAKIQRWVTLYYYSTKGSYSWRTKSKTVVIK
jgi:HSP20 family protein